MTAIKLWLGIDAGTTGLKAALLRRDGHIVHSVTRTYPTRTVPGGVVEQNPSDWWQAAQEAIKELGNLSSMAEVEAVAITGQMQDLILMSRDGTQLRPAILYSDTRARAEAEEINEKLGRDRLKALTGNEQGPDSLLAKLLWLSRYHREALNAEGSHLLLGAADVIVFSLTGTAVTDTTTASTTGLMNLDTRQPLDPELFEEIGIGNALKLLAPIKPGGSQVGTIRKGFMVGGLREGIPVYHGPGDAGATTLGVGSGESGQPYAYLGTSGWVALTSKARALQPGAMTIAHPAADTYIQVAPILTAGANLEWIRDLFSSEDYDALIEQGMWRDPSNLIYLPYLNGERSPFSDPNARAAFIGLNARTSKEDLYRAVLEGVAYAYRHIVATLVPDGVARLIMTGGGMRSQSWPALFADVLGFPVVVAGDPENVGVRGAVLAAQVSRGERSSYAPPDAWALSEAFPPGSTYREHYDGQFEVYTSLYPVLRDAFARLGRA